MFISVSNCPYKLEDSSTRDQVLCVIEHRICHAGYDARGGGHAFDDVKHVHNLVVVQKAVLSKKNCIIFTLW